MCRLFGVASMDCATSAVTITISDGPRKTDDNPLRTDDLPMCERNTLKRNLCVKVLRIYDAEPYRDVNDPGTVQGGVRCFLCLSFPVSTLCEAFLQRGCRLRRSGTPNTMGFVPDADVVQKIVSAWGRCRLHLISNLRATKKDF